MRRNWLLLFLLAIVYIYGLDRAGMLGPDEPRYAAVGLEMARSGDWVTPRLWGEAWFEKPPLLYWLVGAGNTAGLPDPWSARLPVAMVSIAFLAFFFRELRREWNGEIALAASMMLATSAGWLAFSQIAVTDLPMSAALFAAVLLAVQGELTLRRAALSGLLLGLAALGKGLVALVLFAPVAWHRRAEWRRLGVLAALSAATAGPWYAACYAVNGWPFVEELFVKHHFARFATGELLHEQPFWFYLPVLAGAIFPWTPLAGAVFVRKPEPRLGFWWIWLSWGFLFFSLSRNKLPGYVLPLAPALALIMAVAVSRMPNARALLAAAAFLLILTPLITQVLPGALLSGLTRAEFLLDGTDLLAGAGALVAWLAFVYWLGHKPPLAASVTALGLLMGGAVLYAKARVLPVLDREVSARPYWLSIAREADRYCLGEVRRAWVYGLNYYAGRSLPACMEGDGRHRITTEAIEKSGSKP
ncbi:MAG: glycosyltransferase family 39 protein [Bryobacteraceae bacterium]|nr:glycosyltransferase family 39 protein [Bryobacteraceae bacterium]